MRIGSVPRGAAMRVSMKIPLVCIILLQPVYVGATGSDQDGVRFDDVSTQAPHTVSQSMLADQIRRLAWPVKTDISSNASDLLPLTSAIGSAQIVGLGEATHGTSELFTLKDRIVRVLVVNADFTVVAMEANWVESQAIDKYVTTGTGDPKNLLGKLYPIWNNREILEMIKWMRQYDAYPGRRRFLHFVGIDLQSPDSIARALRDEAIKLSPEVRFQLAALTECMDLTIPATYKSFATQSPQGKAACVQSTGRAVQEFSRNRSAWEKVLTPRDFSMAEHAAKMLHDDAQMYSLFDGPRFYQERDAALARNVMWIEQSLYPGARVIVWAHDGHVNSASGSKSMGELLKSRLGDKYYSIGTAVYDGSFSPNGISVPTTLPPPPANFFETLLHGVGMNGFGLNLHDIPAGSLLAKYMSSPQPMRLVGAIDSPSQLAYTTTNITPNRSFNSIIFVNTSHPAHSFEVKRKQDNPSHHWFRVPAKVAGFADSASWDLRGEDPELYRSGFDTRVKFRDLPSLFLTSNVAGPAQWAAVGTRINCSPFLGRRIQLTGFLKTESVADTARFWLRVEDKYRHVLSFDNMSGRTLTGSNNWEPFSIVVDVPGNAARCGLGALLMGPGEVWVNAVKIQAVDVTVPTTV